MEPGEGRRGPHARGRGLLGGGRIRRTVFSRGKFGRESIVFEEAYSAEEYLEVLRAEEALTLGIAPPGEGQERAKRLLLEAIEMLRRVYNGL